MDEGGSDLEPPNGSVAASVAGVVIASNGGNDPLNPLVESDQTLFQKVEGDEVQVQDSEAEAEEEDEEGGDKVTEEGERPKLDDGYFEIEAIRRKRVRKGQLEYLIKWRDWPETANTWEPLENLQSIPDVVDAFEESLRSGKHRKRKRKHAVHHTLPRKRQQRSITSYSLRQFSNSIADNHHQSAPINDHSLADPPALPQIVIFSDGEENGNASSLVQAEPSEENWSANVKQNAGRENDCDPMLTKLKATASSMTTNGVGSDKLAIHIQEVNASTGNGLMDGQSKLDCVEPVQSGRCRGAKRRKSGSVKRFKKDSYACEPDDSQKETITIEQAWTQIADFGGNYGLKTGDANLTNIVKIIKPLTCLASVSSNMPDILVTFMAMRSDGTVVMVDNKYLKANNPLLLINFYEQRLQFNPL